MRKNKLYIIILLFSFSCSNIDHEKRIDDKVDQKIIETFSSVGRDLWSQVEDEMFERIRSMGLMDNKDTIGSLHNLNIEIISAGYTNEFFVDTNKLEIKRMISELKEIGYEIDDECAQSFLYRICSPIVSSYELENNIVLDSTNLIKFFTIHDPDSIDVSYDLSILAFYEENSYFEKSWKYSGTRKMLILLYFSRMINKNRKKKCSLIESDFEYPPPPAPNDTCLPEENVVRL